MAEDEFDIDIYGDANTEQEPEQDPSFKKDEEGDVKIEGVDPIEVTPAVIDSNIVNGTNGVKHVEEQNDDYVDVKVGNSDHAKLNGQQQIKSTDESGQDVLTIPKQAPQQQGVKRKEGSDDRPIDPGATTALLISDLHWWNTDDDVRGWVNQAQVEDELKDITFSEHKVNGKSKGQAYVEFTSQQAATAAKHKIDTFGDGQAYIKKHTVTYSNPNNNPFRTLPKDAPARAGKDGPSNRGSSNGYSNDRGNQNPNFGGGFRGRGQGYNANRGSMNGNMNNNNFNRNFSGPNMNGNMGGGFNSPIGGGFPNNPMVGQFGGGFNRGGMMGGMRGGPGMRGGRGGMNNMMGGMPMGGMPMGGMPGGMGMPMNMGQMGGGMQGTINSNNNQGPPQAYQGSVYNGKAHSATFKSGPPTNLSNPPSLGQYQSTTGGHGTSYYAPPQTYSGAQLAQQKRPYAKRQPDHIAGGGFQPHFNPAFFQPNQAAGGDWQNPHGAKRPRPD